MSLIDILSHEGPYGLYSHIALIPIVSGYLLYLRREQIAASAKWQPWLGLAIVGLGAVLTLSVSSAQTDRLSTNSLHMLSIVVMSWGAFLCSYGVRAFHTGSFALFLLLAMVPLPTFLLDPIVEILQICTAEGVRLFFELLGVPFNRQGVVFTLSNLAIEIAPECSGIRSALVLVICSLVGGHLFLGSLWARVVITLFVIPLAVFKNSARITILSLLGNYVDSKLLTDSALHSSGGIPLFFLSLGVILGMIWVLRRWESDRARLLAAQA